MELDRDHGVHMINLAMSLAENLSDCHLQCDKMMVTCCGRGLEILGSSMVRDTVLVELVMKS